MGNPGQANYAAPRPGSSASARRLLRELASRGITCNAIAPGLIETGMVQIANLPPESQQRRRAPHAAAATSAAWRTCAAAVEFLATDHPLRHRPGARRGRRHRDGEKTKRLRPLAGRAADRHAIAARIAAQPPDGTHRERRSHAHPALPAAPGAACRTLTATSRAASTTPGAGPDRSRVVPAHHREARRQRRQASWPDASMSRRSAPELVKHHLDVLWHDYFKPEHLEKHPGLHETFWKASKQASKVKQSMDVAAAKELLLMIDSIDEMWKTTGGPEKTRVSDARGPFPDRCRRRGPRRAALPCLGSAWRPPGCGGGGRPVVRPGPGAWPVDGPALLPGIACWSRP